MNTKVRATLRAMANSIGVSMQIGKEGTKETSFKAVNELLEARELIKIKVLKNCDMTAREVANALQNELGCEVIQVIGGRIVLYKRSSKDKIKHILED